jgi:hypothetical protein
MLVPIINATLDPRNKGLQGLNFISCGWPVTNGAILEESTIDGLLYLGLPKVGIRWVVEMRF